MIPPNCVLFQLLFDAIKPLLEFRISRVGLASASVIPKGSSDGTMARMMIFFADPLGPWTMNPSIRALSPLPTGRRVETLPTTPGLGVADGVAVAAGVAVAFGVAVAVAVGLGVGLETLIVIVKVWTAAVSCPPFA